MRTCAQIWWRNDFFSFFIFGWWWCCCCCWWCWCCFLLFFFGRGLLVPRYDQLVKLQEGDDAVPEAAVIWAMRAAAKKLTFEPILSDPRVLIEIGGPATTTAMLAVRTTHSTSQYGTLARARFTVTVSAHATCVVLSRSGNGTDLPTCRYTRLFTVTALAHVPSVVLFLCFVCWRANVLHVHNSLFSPKDLPVAKGSDGEGSEAVTIDFELLGTNDTHFNCLSWEIAMRMENGEWTKNYIYNLLRGS